MHSTKTAEVSPIVFLCPGPGDCSSVAVDMHVGLQCMCMHADSRKSLRRIPSQLAVLVTAVRTAKEREVHPPAAELLNQCSSACLCRHFQRAQGQAAAFPAAE